MFLAIDNDNYRLLSVWWNLSSSLKYIRLKKNIRQLNLLLKCLVLKESCEMLARLEIDSSIVSSVQYCSLKRLRPLDLSPTLVSSLFCNSFLLRVSKNTKDLHYIGLNIARSRSVAITETETHTGDT